MYELERIYTAFRDGRIHKVRGQTGNLRTMTPSHQFGNRVLCKNAECSALEIPAILGNDSPARKEWFPSARSLYRGFPLRLFLAAFLTAASSLNCQKDDERQPTTTEPSAELRTADSDKPTQRQEPLAPKESTKSSDALLATAALETSWLINDITLRWFWVEHAKGGARGGWGQAGFDHDSNKFTIVTSDVTQFSIDASRARPNWHRPVVLEIDDATSELRKRDHTIYRFMKDSHGKWIIIEP